MIQDFYYLWLTFLLSFFPQLAQFYFSRYNEMDRGVKETGLKRIRIHDLRHSHVSLLIELGFSAVAIADRVGHESIEITYRYAHLFPSKQAEMANRLGELKKKRGDADVSEES